MRRYENPPNATREEMRRNKLLHIRTELLEAYDRSEWKPDFYTLNGTEHKLALDVMYRITAKEDFAALCRAGGMTWPHYCDVMEAWGSGPYKKIYHFVNSSFAAYALKSDGNLPPQELWGKNRPSYDPYGSYEAEKEGDRRREDWSKKRQEYRAAKRRPFVESSLEETFAPELQLLSAYSGRFAEAAKALFARIGENFKSYPASLTGCYHPSDENGAGGKLFHTKRAVNYFIHWMMPFLTDPGHLIDGKRLFSREDFAAGLFALIFHAVFPRHSHPVYPT